MGFRDVGSEGQIRSCSLLQTGSVAAQAMDPQQAYGAGATHAVQGPWRLAGYVAVQLPPPVAQYIWSVNPSPALASFAGQRLYTSGSGAPVLIYTSLPFLVAKLSKKLQPTKMTDAVAELI